MTIYDIGATGDVVYIAMELIEGRTLRDLENEGPDRGISQETPELACVRSWVSRSRLAAKGASAVHPR